jgi:superfamily II DNA/RNA helicase
MNTNENVATCVAEALQSFSAITNPKLLTALAQLSITEPTPVQREAIPRVLQGGDYIVEAQTGSGKTLAFVLPILSKLLDAMPYNGNFALIVTPTRELAMQVASVVSDVLPEVEPACIIGGERQEKQVRALRKDPRIVVGTPGRLLDLIDQRELVLRKCQMFVLDEADEMLSMGFIDEIRAILSKLPRERQGLFFSATMTPRVLSLASSFLTKPTRVELEPVVETTALIDHIYCRVDGALTAKAQALAAFLTVRKPKSAIVFCNTKSDTELLEIMLRKRGIESKRINSDLSQKERERTMGAFRSGELNLLIATDVAARGIDVSDVELVVNYSLHDTPETYVHRTGRTGRAGKSGTALTLIAPQDFPLFFHLSRRLPVTLTEVPVPA